jgi:hypothetical protein
LIAVVTAGGTVAGAFAEAIGTDVKALAPLGAGRLIDPVLRAARESGASRLAVVGGAEVLAHCVGRIDDAIAAGATGGANVLLALGAGDDDLLYCTSDLPYCTGRALAAFVERSARFAVTMPLADSSAYELRFPGAPAHLMTLGGERFANGSVFFIRRDAIGPLRDFAVRFFDARKSALAMAALLGPGLLLRYALRRLGIADIERKAQRSLGLPAGAIRGASPELCFDVDTLDEYRYACSHA